MTKGKKNEYRMMYSILRQAGMPTDKGREAREV